MSTDALLDNLEQSQSLLRALIEDSDESSFREQYHHDLSALGWHLGHCVYVECFWLHEKIRGDDRVTAPLADLYTPPRTPKPQRGKLLPAREALLAWAQEMQDFNLHYLRNLQPQWRRHPLFENDYVIHFILQHNSQHYETMLMVLAQKSLGQHRANGAPHSPLRAAPLQRDSVDIPAGHYRIGGDRPVAYDNEVPPQKADLGPFAIARRPVSNAEYLAFIEDGGYRKRELWHDAGWLWLQDSRTEQPEHWRRSRSGEWYAVGLRGTCDLPPDDPVYGINHYEAGAFARWAGARLPHEYQWEAACRIGALEQTGRVWEWCSNTFHPYDGFTPFPYPEYSQPWFDERHFSLKGGSLHTRPAIKRPSFRNFFEADKRHVFAGLRLAY
ncbi:MAG: SUMF1/EgtB/PvdO family nonheme iron enzyme [Gammaproteobacteria bacterium]